MQLRLVAARARPQPIERGLRAIVGALEPGADALLAPQLHRGLEQIHHQAQFVAVEIIEQADGGWAVVAVPANQLADVGPVLLLDVGVIVLLVGAAASELDLPGAAVAPGGG